jgi:hypothetical protein
MFARLLIIFAAIVGLLGGPAASQGLCSPKPACACCPAAVTMACCDSTPDPTPTPSAPIAPDAKQAPAPILFVIACLPFMEAGQNPVHRQWAARVPARPLVERICVRLI